MSKLSSRFELLKQRGEKALVLFVSAGDPPLDQLPSLVSALEEGGADVIELGIPFSDPIADGPIIQASNQRALDRGVTPKAVLAALKGCTSQVPVVLMGYYNPVLRWGLEEFAVEAAASGVSGTIITDLTPEESGRWLEASKHNGLDTIFLAAPTSTESRLEEVCRHSSGFVYAVSRTGVTGSAASVPDEVSTLVSRIRACTDLPVCVGFGISTPEHVRSISTVADGAVIGSWLVDWVDKNWNEGAGRAALVAAIRKLKGLE